MLNMLIDFQKASNIWPISQIKMCTAVDYTTLQPYGMHLSSSKEEGSRTQTSHLIGGLAICSDFI